MPPAPNGQHTVTLGGQSVALTLPASPSMRLDIFFAAATNLDRAAVAALGACWGDRETRPRVSYARAKHDALAYGGAVLDALLGRGLGYRDVMRAAGEAFVAIEGSVRPLLADLADPDEVAAVEDFTVAPAGAGSV